MIATILWTIQESMRSRRPFLAFGFAVRSIRPPTNRKSATDFSKSNTHHSWFAVLAVGAIGFVTLDGFGAESDSSKSGLAIIALKSELAAKPIHVENFSRKDFATAPLTKADSATARKLPWKAHADFIAKDRAPEIRDRVLKDGDLEMPYFTKRFGKKPAAGWSLWISLHGGGGAPREVNDQQYENQKHLYPLKEGIYLVPRAPTDNWNLWHEPHIDRMLARLIEDLIAVEEVDPNRVYVLGYSAGGDGVYQLAPRMADYWAAAAMMAGHPNDASPLGLRNVPFAIQVGANDGAYNRNKVAADWGEKLDALRKEHPGGYEHFVKIHKDKGHWMDLEDKVALPWMARHRRNPVPKKIVWKQAGTTHEQFYWLAVPRGSAKGGSLVTASVKEQTIDISAAEQIERLLVHLDDRLLDLDKPVKVVLNGKVLFDGLTSRTIETLIRTLASRGDPMLMFDAEIAVESSAGATQ